MATTNITFRIDSDLKKEAEELFGDFGLSMSSAFVMFLKQSVWERKIPFEISRSPQSKKPCTGAAGPNCEANKSQNC